MTEVRAQTVEATQFADKLEPLTHQSDRRDIQQRLIGPVVTAATVGALDAYRQNPTAADLDSSINQTFDTQQERIYLHDVFIGDLRMQILPEIMATIAEQQYEEAKYLSSSQSALLRDFTHYGRVSALVREGCDAQESVTFNMALPGYVATQHDLSNSRQIVESYKAIGTEGIATILRSRPFLASLSRLALTANRMYANMNNRPNVDIKGLVLRAERITNGMAPDAPPAANVFQLYEKDKHGIVVLSERTRNVLRYCLNYRNDTQPLEGPIIGAEGLSRGCPVVQASVRVRPDEYTDELWKILLEGDNPIASYNTDTSRLAMHRTVVPELSNFIAGIMTGNISPTGAN